jgi:hypothetical protein
MEALRQEHIYRRADFNRAIDLWRPDACVPYAQGYRLNPPEPSTYNGYFYSYEETGQQIDELISKFNRLVN